MKAPRHNKGELVEYRMPIEGTTCADCEQSVPQSGYGPGEVESITLQKRPARSNGRGGGDRVDLAIVGSGGGAFAAAITAVERGAQVIMIERGALGGTCVNIGCIPSKTQLRAGDLFWHAGHQPFAGINTRAQTVDLPRLVHQKDELVAALRKEKYADLTDEYGWELLRGEARFEDETTLRVGGRSIQADGFVLASGARPAVPPIPGLDQGDDLRRRAGSAIPSHGQGPHRHFCTLPHHERGLEAGGADLRSRRVQTVMLLRIEIKEH